MVGVTQSFETTLGLMDHICHGWILRTMHTSGCTFVFIVLIIHIAKASYFKINVLSKTTRAKTTKNIFAFGVLIFLISMGVAFLGYALVFGQMSFWGIIVIVSLLMPIIDATELIKGGFSLTDATLTRLYTFHFILPFVAMALAIKHIASLHIEGSSLTSVVSSKEHTIEFTPYFIVKDLYGIFIATFIIFTLFILCGIVYVCHPDNSWESNPLVTPARIVPEWYFLPFYGVLRSIAQKECGILCFLLAAVRFIKGDLLCHEILILIMLYIIGGTCSAEPSSYVAGFSLIPLIW